MRVPIPAQVPYVLWFHTPHPLPRRIYRLKENYTFLSRFFFSSHRFYFGKGYFHYIEKNTIYESHYFFIWGNDFKLDTNMRLDRLHVWTFLPLFATSDVLHK